MFVPLSYDVNPSHLLYYRQTAMEHNKGMSEESDDNYTEDDSSSLISNRYLSYTVYSNYEAANM
jgi:hypothetical protein